MGGSQVPPPKKMQKMRKMQQNAKKICKKVAKGKKNAKGQKICICIVCPALLQVGKNKLGVSFKWGRKKSKQVGASSRGKQLEWDQCHSVRIAVKSSQDNTNKLAARKMQYETKQLTAAICDRSLSRSPPTGGGVVVAGFRGSGVSMGFAASSPPMG